MRKEIKEVDDSEADDFSRSYEDEQERTIYTKDQERIRKKYNSKRSPIFRLTAEYLKSHFFDGKLDKKKISKDLKISMESLNLYICELNRFEDFQPIRWIASAGEKDFIEPAGLNPRKTNHWIKRNMKGLVSRSARVYQTREKAKAHEELKALEDMKIRKKKKVEIKVKNKR